MKNLFSLSLSCLCLAAASLFAASASANEISISTGTASARSAPAAITSAGPSSFLVKTRSLLSSKFTLGNHPSRPSDVNNVHVDVKIDRPLSSINVSSSVRIVKKFLLPSETNLYRHNENKYDHIPAVGFSGDRMWGGAYLPRSFMRRLIDVGAKQCASKKYDDALPNGMHILTNYIKETTDPHLDVNPTTLKYINNDVGVIFLNTNEDAVFIVGNEEFPIEEGTLITFPGGSVPHHIEMKKKKGGFVHMLGPFEVGESHGTVGQFSRAGLAIGDGWGGSPVADCQFDGVQATFKLNGRKLEDANQESTNTSTSPSDTHITGEVYVYGYINGTDPDGGTNLTLEVQYNLEGLGTACINGSCSVEVKGKDTYTCDDVYAAQLESDEPSSAPDDNGHYILLKNISHTEVSQGIVYVDIGHPVHHLFDRPVVLHGHDGAILACAIFTEIKDNTASNTNTTGTGTGNSPSGAMGSTVGLVALVVFVASFAASFVTAL